MTFKSPLRGVQALRRRQRALYGGSGPYYEKILSYSPIAYWPLWESFGTTAECLVNSAQNGTYDSDVSGWPPQTGIGDGNTAPYFSGDDYLDIHTATLQSAFNGSEGTAMIWERVYNSGVWTDGTTRIGMSLWADDNNQVQLSKISNNNELWFRYIAGGTAEDMREYGISTTAWFCHIITWSKSNDRAIAYRDGNTIDTNTGLGVWAGNLNALATRIGNLTVGANAWYGWLAHAAIWDTELTPSQVATISNV